jgi:hypothetical protein
MYSEFYRGRCRVWNNWIQKKMISIHRTLDSLHPVFVNKKEFLH